MKRVFLILLVLTVMVAGLVFAKDLLAKAIFAGTVKRLTGFDTTIESLSFHPFTGVFSLRGLVLKNPSGFEKEIFVDIPEVSVEANLPALIRREKTHLRELRLNIQEFHIEKTKEGVSNLSLLNPVKETKKKEKAPPIQEKGKAPPFQLDRLELTLRRVSYNDRSSLVPKKLSTDLRIEKLEFRGIRDPKSIVNLILMKVATSARLPDLGIDTERIKEQVSGSVELVRTQFLETKDALAETSSELSQKVLTDGREKLGEVGSTAKEEITGLFGKLKSSISE